LTTTSTDGGNTFGESVVVDDVIEPPERVMLIFTMAPPSLVATSGTLCVGWTDARNGDADVLTSCSTDDGGTWPAPVRVNDDPLGNGKRQYLPRLATSSAGRIDAVFYDRRADPENLLNHVSYTFSTDGGRSFAPNVALTRFPSNSQIGQQYAGPAADGQYEIGNRLGLLSRPDGAVAAWADSRNSLPMSTAQDLFTTEVTLGELRATPSRPRLVGLAIVAVGLVVLVTGLRQERARRSANLSLTAGEEAKG
jgi:hypothetical protein